METNFTWAQLQGEQQPWVLHNFGNRPASQPLRGIVEELGEFVDSSTYEEKLDACADIMIFACDYCSGKGWNLEEVMSMKKSERMTQTLEQFFLSTLGKLCHADLKTEQKIRTNEDHEQNGKQALSDLLHRIEEHTIEKYSISLIYIVEKTWSKVKLRDWKKNSSNAGEVK